MKLQNNKYEIEIKIDEDFYSGNDGHRGYDYVFGLEKVNEFYDANLDRTLSVNVKAGDKAVKIALTGENYSFDRNCAVLEDDVLTVLQNTTITQIDLRGFKRILHKNINECFFGFELYKVKDFYILYGETEIIRLDKNFNCVWTFSGIDIFTTLDNTSAFVIDDDRIKLRDFQNNYYEINFDGKLIKKELLEHRER